MPSPTPSENNGHTHSSGRSLNHRLRLSFISYSIQEGLPTVSVPAVKLISCKHLRCPPQRLLEKYTGLDPEISKSFFSDRKNEDAYRDALRRLKGILRDMKDKQPHLAVLVSCVHGMHRSVAMAERLAQEVRSWPGVKVLPCEHVDLKARMERRERRQKAAERRKMMELEHEDRRGRSPYRRGEKPKREERDDDALPAQKSVEVRVKQPSASKGRSGWTRKPSKMKVWIRQQCGRLF